jgi:cell division protein FtsA
MVEENIIVGLDIGTSKIACVIAEVASSQEPKVIGVGLNPSEGLKKGVVVDLEKTVNSITKAVQDAELMAGVKISSAFVGIAGEHIKSINSRGVIGVSRSDEITKQDIERVINAARAIAIPMDREIIHVIPQEYTVDEQSGIKDPTGMSGTRLEVEVHIVTAAVTSAQNLLKSVRKAGIEVADLVLEPLAESYSLLSPQEGELGAVLLDLGGGTTNVAIFYDGCIRHTAVIGLGGKNVTNDLAIGLRTPVDQAEELKKSYGCALSSLANADELIQVPSVGGRDPREISRSVLASIIEPRMEEIFSLALREVKKSSFSDMLASGIVLTGGGSLMEGVIDLAEQIFDMPVKKGTPKNIAGLVDIASNPIYSAGVGLIFYGMNQSKTKKGKKTTPGSWFGRKFKGIKNWFEEYF